MRLFVCYTMRSTCYTRHVTPCIRWVFRPSVCVSPCVPPCQCFRWGASCVFSYRYMQLRVPPQIPSGLPPLFAIHTLRVPRVFSRPLQRAFPPAVHLCVPPYDPGRSAISRNPSVLPWVPSGLLLRSPHIRCAWVLPAFPHFCHVFRHALPIAFSYSHSFPPGSL